jgi:hypothetical protein
MVQDADNGGQDAEDERSIVIPSVALGLRVLLGVNAAPL